MLRRKCGSDAAETPLPPNETFFVPCARGVEPYLHAELETLRFGRVERQVGGARFEGTLADARRANLELRTATRVLWRQSRFEARDGDELYAGVQAVDWTRFLAPSGSLRVDAQTGESALDHTLFIEQRVKDAVVDSFRERTGERPNVDKEDADLPIHVHVHRDRCTLSVDTSGDSLHLRGWRRFQGRAPLAENLAAAIVMASGWDRRSPLVDPMCGSATLLVEAALIACDHAPGLFRERFAFQRWPGHDAAAWERQREAARARIKLPKKLVLRGFDADPHAIEGARENARSAGVDELIEFGAAPLERFAPRPGWNAWIVSNPPYGQRIGDARELPGLFARLGRQLRENCAGYHVALLSGDPQLTRALGLEPARRIPLKNGGLDCELLLFDL